MRRFLLNTALIFLAFTLQSTVIKYAELANVSPNIMLLVPVIGGFIYGQREGIYLGFFSGFIFDIFFCNVIGLNSFIFMIIGLFSGTFTEHYNKDELIIPLATVLIGDIVYGFLNYVFNFLLRNRLDIGYFFGKIIIPETVYTLFVTILVYKIILFLYRFEQKKHERKIKRYVF